MIRSTVRPIRGPALLAAAVATGLLASCASVPQKPAGSADARAKLTALQSDPALANLAPAATAAAEAAVVTAERPEPDRALADYRVYIADRKVDTAKALAETRLAENERAQIVAQRTAARLESRTQEADRAKTAAATANANAATADANAATARADARTQAEDAAATANEMQQQIDALKAKATNRGLVLTLGDVLFATGRANLKSGAAGHLDRLVAFLKRYPDRTVVIEGYTDNVGSEDSNLGLSERRAQAVRSYLTDQGIAGSRITATGKGEADPVASNETASGRQRNRRVEVIINNATTASDATPQD